jgi:hypothetical protein
VEDGRLRHQLPPHRLVRTIMTTTLPDTRPAKASRSSWGFCEGGHGQPPSVCYDANGRCKGTCYGAVPALTLAVAMATLSRARVSSTLARPWACIRRPARRLFQSGMHTGSAISAPSPASGDPARPLRSRTAPRGPMPWTA